MNAATPGTRLTVDDIGRRKREGVPIVMATAYDYVSGSAVDAAGVDIILVGDSAATTMLGLTATRDVTLPEMLMLTRAVSRGVSRALLVGDLPFGSYESSDDRAVATAREFAAAGCGAVKMEGAGAIVERVSAVIRSGIPVMGHVGLRPQQLVAGEPGHVEGKTADQAVQVILDAKALEAVGCFALVVEAVPAQLGDTLVRHVGLPVIGIGAGASTDGQVLVTYDLVGLTEGHVPKFVKKYREMRQELIEAMKEFSADVRARRYPAREHSYGMSAAELESLRLQVSRWEATSR